MSPTEHTLVEVGEIRRGDKGLAASLHGIHQSFAAGTIKLTHHIVQKKNRLLLQELFHPNPASLTSFTPNSNHAEDETFST